MENKELRWNLIDNTGRRVAPGMYFIRVKQDGFIVVKKLIVN
ncbi:MAG: T9SS type A sorting domain-containing protein [Bacteroidales bacterium]|nr:T9SS type A sorting domain-containing protein [Bacteroidales bacterium]